MFNGCFSDPHTAIGYRSAWHIRGFTTSVGYAIGKHARSLVVDSPLPAPLNLMPQPCRWGRIMLRFSDGNVMVETEIAVPGRSTRG